MALGLVLVGCTQPGADAVTCGGNGQDSTRAVRIALDTLGKVERFQSVVLRYSRDSTGVRVVTMPAPSAKVLDGMGIVRVGPSCKVLSVVQTDSA